MEYSGGAAQHNDYVRVSILPNKGPSDIADDLHKKRDADAKHDLKPIPPSSRKNNGEITSDDVKNTYPLSTYEWGVYSNSNNGVKDEDSLLEEFVYQNLGTRELHDDIKNFYNFANVTYIHDTVYDKKNKEEKMASKFYPIIKPDNLNEKSLIQEQLEKFGVKGNIFLFVDTAKAKLKKDLTYAYDDTIFFWADSRAQKYDAAGSTNPDTEIGKKMCGWNKGVNKNFRYCWEYVQPGLTTGYLFNKYDTTKTPILPQECVFSKYDIQLIATTTNAYDPNELEGKLVMTYNDNGKSKYIYSDKTLSNKSGTNVSMYLTAAQSISKFLSVLVPQNTTISNWTNSSLVISKYCGDTLQLLLAMIAATIGVYVLYELKPGEMQTEGGGKIQQIGGLNENNTKTIKTNKNCIFVTNDRIAAETAIYVLGMIVIFDRGSTCDIFVPKSYQNPCSQFKESFPENEAYYKSIYDKYNRQYTEFSTNKDQFIEQINILKSNILEIFKIQINFERLVDADVKTKGKVITEADETYRRIIALWKIALQITPMYSNFEEMKKQVHELSEFVFDYNKIKSIIDETNEICLKKQQTEDEIKKIFENTDRLNTILNPCKEETNKLSSFNKSLSDLYFLLLTTNTDLNLFLNNPDSLKKKKLWEYKIKSEILFNASPVSESDKPRTTFSRIKNLFSNDSQYCSIFAMGDIMTICDFLKGPLGSEEIEIELKNSENTENIENNEKMITSSKDYVYDLFYKQIDGLIEKLEINGKNDNFKNLLNQFKNKFNELKIKEIENEEIENEEIIQTGGGNTQSNKQSNKQVNDDNQNLTQNPQTDNEYSDVDNDDDDNDDDNDDEKLQLQVIEEDNDISNFTKILKIELLLKIFCLIKKNINFKRYDFTTNNNEVFCLDDDENCDYNDNDNNVDNVDNNNDNDGVETSRKRNRDSDDDEEKSYYIKNNDNEESITNRNVIDYLQKLQNETELVLVDFEEEESNPLEELLNPQEANRMTNDSVYFDIITFNDIEAIINMNSNDEPFDKKFKNIMNLIFLSKENEITILVDGEFYNLFEIVCNEIKDALKQKKQRTKYEEGGNIKHNILKRNTHKYIEKTNKKTKRRNNKKVSKKKLIKSNSKTRKYRRKRLS